MSSSNTISNLQQALNCAAKCDCCDQLQSKINSLNQRLQELEQKQKKCCGQNKTNNDSPLEKRVAKLQKNEEALKTGIVQTLNNFADIENTNRDFTLAFQGLYSMITPLMGAVSTVIKLLGVDTE